MTREAAAAGRFYPDSATLLNAEVDHLLAGEGPGEKAIAAVCPHAGYMYSGRVAGSVYSSIKIPKKIVLLGPNHTGVGPQFSIMTEGQWEVPNGRLPVDAPLARRVLDEVPFFTGDEAAHIFEHSLEVQLPFVVRLRPDAAIVPVVMMQALLDYLRKAGEGLARALEADREDVLIIASSDMSHYVPEEMARKMDALAIEHILKLDPEGLLQTVSEKRISMCGAAAVAVMLYAAKLLGASEARLTQYATSGQASGDYSQVVGYAGIIIK
ncbi:MAG: AmmeMemoRadiSam system protein B [Nitrospiraceae bacterium]|nr:AmmeMemoRadiSam system protein B [Nitrospiraceae bacterium]